MTVQNGQCFFEENNHILNLTAQIRLLHNLNPEELVFKTFRGFFYFLISYFVICVSNLLIKILLMCIMPEAIMGDQF